MSHRSRCRSAARAFTRLVAPRVLVLAVVVTVALVAGACGTATPVASFDPSSACTSDGRMPGAYPELEALLPRSYEGAAPATVDSGRNCTNDALGTLADHGIAGVRFAGATWPLGGTTGLTVAVFQADGLDPATLLDFYARGAADANRTDKLQTSDTTVGGQPAKRLDVLRSDGTGSTIVTWPGGAPGRVMVLLASDLGDAKVVEALDTFGGA
jgi:hypothetical protein